MTFLTTAPFLQLMVFRVGLIGVTTGSEIVRVVFETLAPSCTAKITHRIELFFSREVMSHLTDFTEPIPLTLLVKSGKRNLGETTKLSDEKIEAFELAISNR